MLQVTEWNLIQHMTLTLLSCLKFHKDTTYKDTKLNYEMCMACRLFLVVELIKHFFLINLVYFPTNRNCP